MFHKADIGGDAGAWLSHELVAALAEPDLVVGVVLNTIDDALDHGQEGDRVEWRVNDVTYLRSLLDAARSYQRPLVVVSDHGHVLDRGGQQTSASGIESARWRRGSPGVGEVALSGPRVVYGKGELVVPWREDIRYTARKAGYHGGAGLAEMTVPVMVLLPSLELLPEGWHVLPRERSEPAWWEARTVHPQVDSGPAEPRPTRKVPGRRKTAPDDNEALFPVEPAATAPAGSLGERVVACKVYERQRAMVPRAPDKQVVAAVIDGLAARPDGMLTASAVAAMAGRAARRPEFFVSMLGRLLNVDGYPIVSVMDNGAHVKLDVTTLRVQFGITGS